MKASELLANIRDLAVLLHRGNAKQAETILEEITGSLNAVMVAEGNGEDGVHRAQQTMFAIDEVRILMTQGDFHSAATAARDAAREWGHP